jgi:hypothetical protein
MNFVLYSVDDILNSVALKLVTVSVTNIVIRAWNVDVV